MCLEVRHTRLTRQHRMRKAQRHHTMRNEKILIVLYLFSYNSIQ